MSEPYPVPVGDVLYGLLPSVFQQADVGQGYPLLALSHVFGEVLDGLEAGIPELVAGWFIETCPLERVPAVGAMLGVAVPEPVRPEHRALVADALAIARRRGRAATLPRLVRGATGWYALYVDFADTPLGAAWPLGPKATAGTPMPKPPDTDPPNSVGSLLVWGLPVASATDATPAPVGDGALRYAFEPLGYERPLFNVPTTPLPFEPVAPVTALPVPLDRAMIAADLAAYRRLWPADGPADSLLYGPARGLVIRALTGEGVWVDVPPSKVRAASLGPDDPALPAYPVLLSGAIDPARLDPGDHTLAITLGDTHAEAIVTIGPVARVPDLVEALQAALDGARIIRQGAVPEAAIHTLIVGAIGSHLAILPTRTPNARLDVSAVDGDPLRLSGTARPAALATDRLGPEAIARLTGATAGSSLRFSAIGGRALTVPLPLVLPSDVDPAVAVAGAVQAALPDCLVRAADGRIVIVSLPGGQPPGDEPPAASDLAFELGLADAVGIDPERGLFAWPPGWPAPGPLSVDYGRARLAGDNDAPEPTDRGDPPDPIEPGGLGGRLDAWDGQTLDLRIRPGDTAVLARTDLAPGPGQRLRIGGGTGDRPCLRVGSLRLTGSVEGMAPAAIALHGLDAVASLVLAGRLDLDLTDTSLVPAPEQAVLSGSTGAGGAVRIAHCRVGALDLAAFMGTLDVADTVIGLAPEPDFSATQLALSDAAATRIARSTVLGAVDASGDFEAIDTLFAGPMTCSGPARFDHCFVTRLDAPRATQAVAGDASVTRCTACGKIRAVALRNCHLIDFRLKPDDPGQCTCSEALASGGPDDRPTPGDAPPRDCTTCADASCAESCPLRQRGQLWGAVGAGPDFYSANHYPMPHFARLAQSTPSRIRLGASDGDEIGVCNGAAPASRLRRLDDALRDNLLFGTALDVRFET